MLCLFGSVHSRSIFLFCTNHIYLLSESMSLFKCLGYILINTFDGNHNIPSYTRHIKWNYHQNHYLTNFLSIISFYCGYIYIYMRSFKVKIINYQERKQKVEVLLQNPRLYIKPAVGASTIVKNVPSKTLILCHVW